MDPLMVVSKRAGVPEWSGYATSQRPWVAYLHSLRDWLSGVPEHRAYLAMEASCPGSK